MKRFDTAITQNQLEPFDEASVRRPHGLPSAPSRWALACVLGAAASLFAAASATARQPACAVAPELATAPHGFDGRAGSSFRLHATQGVGDLLEERDARGMWTPMIVAATHLEVQPEGAAAPTLRVSWCGNRAASIAGVRHRFDMLPIVSEAPVDIPIERGPNGWFARLPECRAAGFHAAAYRFDAGRWSVTAGGATYPLDPDVQEEFVFAAPNPADIDGNAVPDALLRYEERFGSGRQAFVAVLLGCGDGSFVLAGSAPLGPVGSTATVTPRPASGLALRVTGRSGARFFRLDSATAALVTSPAPR